ncbi:MAG: ribonuclease HII [Flammeovirgaceae bacterium]|nr:ribonuclease HII [Flammeovirgaceae bacterium]
MLAPYFDKEKVEVGLDEVGRGCLAGPVVAAAVILPKGFKSDILNDSKKVTKSNRNKLRLEIQEKALAYYVAEVSHEEIDKINILNASFLAMHLALDQIKIPFDLLLVDGNRFNPYKDVPFECIIKGDGKYASIAAASILAKTYRDELMEDLAKTYPGYGWETNVGYPTKAHREGIRVLGETPLHRKSFKLLPEQLEINYTK